MSDKQPFDVVVEPMAEQDWPAVRDIYAEGIEFGDATFETNPPDWEAWNAAHLRACRLVARHGGEVVGWTAMSPVASRPAHAGVVGDRCVPVLHAVADAAQPVGEQTGRVVSRSRPLAQ